MNRLHRSNHWIRFLSIFVTLVGGFIAPSLPQISWVEDKARAASTTLVISEVLYDPEGNEPDGEWIEIYNISRISVDLTNYKIGDEVTPGGTEGMMQFPAGASIAPRQIIVVANRASDFFTTNSFKPDYEMLASDPSVPDMQPSGWSNGSVALSNDDDEILLLNENNNIIDALSYGSSLQIFNPPVPDVPQGHSIERYPVNWDTDTNSEWIDQPNPNPGEVYLDQIEVYNPSDTGLGTLRNAFLNADAGTTITFDPVVFPPGSPTSIFIQSPLPALSLNNITIDASDRGVIINGSLSPIGTHGITISADNCTIKGLAIVNFPENGLLITFGSSDNRIGGDRMLGTGPHGQGNQISNNGGNGIEIRGLGATTNWILGNYIGLDSSGMTGWGNGQNGILITQGASNNFIGDGTTTGKNLISGNQDSGIRIEGFATSNNTIQQNYIGSNAIGTSAIPNGMHGVDLTDSTHNNIIGGNRFVGEGNLISGNANHGVVISQAAYTNTISGNLIGTDISGMQSLRHHAYGGIDITSGANSNVIGGIGAGEGNIISGNDTDGIALYNEGTDNNEILGNLIGLASDGETPLPNRGDGIFHVLDAEFTHIEGNIVSGNWGNGISLRGMTSAHSTLVSNSIGTNQDNTRAVPNSRYGVLISEGAHDHLIESNTISGNKLGGVLIQDQDLGKAPFGNIIKNNYIGIDSSETIPLGNGGPGISVLQNAHDNLIGTGNQIALNQGYGVFIENCQGNTITQNAIYSNTLGGIHSDCIPAPQLITVTISTSENVSGLTTPSAVVEFFTGNDDPGRHYEGSTQADVNGSFQFSKAGGFSHPNLTATSTDPDGNTSGFSRVVHFSWTFLLYLNGDNDLEEFMFDVTKNISASGPSPQANILALVDGYTNTVTQTGTVLYDLTYGEAIPITISLPITAEANMGDEQTLIDFVLWGQDYYPARHTLLSIVDHGGGWAPDSDEFIPGTLRPKRKRGYLAGASGLSWDFSNDYDYLDIQEISRTLATITNDGTEPLDVIFFDVCLMGMIEVAYQIKDFADFFVASQNIGWAPLGPQNRYVRTMLELEPDPSPQQVAERLVESYARAISPEGHPFTISAIDLSSLPDLANSVNQLAIAINQLLTGTEQAMLLHEVYLQTQKIDYDSDLDLEPDTDGFVDLHDLAQNIQVYFTDTAVSSAAQTLINQLDNAIVAESHRSGSPWMLPERTWDLDEVHGLSVFFPLGEDLEIHVVITGTDPISPSIPVTYVVRLRDTYTNSQLLFVQDTTWKNLIDTYYEIIGSSITTDTVKGPVDGLLTPDISPPYTEIAVTGNYFQGQTVNVNWVTTDTQAGVDYLTLWYSPTIGESSAILTTTESAGTYPLTLNNYCDIRIAMLGTDKAGNHETSIEGQNTHLIWVLPCYRLFLPINSR